MIKQAFVILGILLVWAGCGDINTRPPEDTQESDNVSSEPVAAPSPSQCELRVEALSDQALHNLTRAHCKTVACSKFIKEILIKQCEDAQ